MILLDPFGVITPTAMYGRAVSRCYIRIPIQGTLALVPRVSHEQRFHCSFLYHVYMMLISAQEKPKTWAALAASRAPSAPTNTAPTTNSRPARQPQPVRFESGDFM